MNENGELCEDLCFKNDLTDTSIRSHGYHVLRKIELATQLQAGKGDLRSQISAVAEDHCKNDHQLLVSGIHIKLAVNINRRSSRGINLI